MNLIWFVMNMFTSQFTIETKWSKESVLRAIKSYTDTTRSIYALENLSTKEYIGYVGEGGFEITKPSNKHYRKEIISGSVDDAKDGASVFIKVKMSYYQMLLTGGIILVFFISLYKLIEGWLATGSPNVNSVLLFLLAILGIITYVIIIKYVLKSIKDNFKLIVQGADYKEDY